MHSSTLTLSSVSSGVNKGDPCPKRQDHGEEWRDGLMEHSAVLGSLEALNPARTVMDN